MKKVLVWAFIAMTAILFTAWATQAAEVVLPKFIGPHTLAWDDPNPASAAITGYHVFYRPVGGTWDDTRMATVAAPTKIYDLLGIISVSGNYEVTVSAFSATGESGLATAIPFLYGVPQSVSNLRKQ